MFQPQYHPQRQALNLTFPPHPQAQDPRVLGAGGSRLPQLIAVLVQVLGRGKDLIDADVAPRAVALLAALRANPQYTPITDAAFAALSDKHKANFTAHMEGRA